MYNSSCNQEYVHQDKKVKVNCDYKQNVGNIDFFQHNNFNDCHSSVQADNQLSPIFQLILLNQQTEINNRIKNTIKMKHNLTEVDLLKILHNLNCSISANDTIVGRATRWNSKNEIFDSSSSYKFKKRDQLLRDLAIRYDMTNMKPMQLNLQLQNSNMNSEITTKVSCFDFKQQLLSILYDDNIMNPKNLGFKNEPVEDPDFNTDQRKHIHDTERYMSANHYYTDEYGYEHTQL